MAQFLEGLEFFLCVIFAALRALWGFIRAMNYV